MARHDFKDLKAACAGQWESIIRTLSIDDINDAIDTKKHVRCPKNHGRTKSQFRVFPDFDQTGGGVCNTCGSFPDGFKLLGFLNGWDNKKAIKEVAELLKSRGFLQDGESNPKARKPSAPAKKSFELNESRVERLTKIWSEGQEIDGTPAEMYFRNRGLTCEMPRISEMRYHPGLDYWDAEKDASLGKIPAILSMVRSSKKGSPLTIHRTYITKEGLKADVPTVKKLMPCAIDGAISELGAAVRLYKLNGPVMAITEGIETAMAIRSANPGLCVWAAYSANVLTNFKTPFGVKMVEIYGDVDSSGTGQVASARLALQLERRKCRTKLCLPSESIVLPEEDRGWFNSEISRQDVIERLTDDEYRISDECDDVDWLDVWNRSKEEVKKVRSRLSARYV